MLNIKPLKNTVIAFTIAGAIYINPMSVQAELGDKVLKKGITHEDVQVLQQHLKDLGYLELEETTTYYGDMTFNAVKDFQKSQGLSVDGCFGSASFKTLQNVLDKHEPLEYNRVLKKDLTGKDVQALQERLKSLGFLKIDNCTTYYGSMTEEAVKNFQDEYNIKVDGIAGLETIKTINGVLSGKIRKPAPTSSRGGSTSSSIGKRIVATARKHLGVSYVYGGSSPSGFDCSGFTHYVYKQYGISIPRSSSSQASVGTKVSKGNLQVGDLVIFSNTYKSGPSHAGIYVGNNKFIHASTSDKGVIISDLTSNYYSKHFSYGRRVF